MGCDQADGQLGEVLEEAHGGLRHEGFRFHDLRHTFRTQGAEAGVPLEVMMAQLGHMDRQTSLDYVHIQQRALERAKQLIEAEQAEILASAHVSERLLEADSHR